jgi:hypothetical protein
MSAPTVQPDAHSAPPGTYKAAVVHAFDSP